MSHNTGQSSSHLLWKTCVYLRKDISILATDNHVCFMLSLWIWTVYGNKWWNFSKVKFPENSSSYKTICAKIEFVKPNNFLTRSPRAKFLAYCHQYIENQLKNVSSIAEIFLEIWRHLALATLSPLLLLGYWLYVLSLSLMSIELLVWEQCGTKSFHDFLSDFCTFVEMANVRCSCTMHHLCPMVLVFRAPYPNRWVDALLMT